MPKVNAEHLERRRREILCAARACFVRNGFHQTSMRDVLAESRLSAGAVYRYFPTKDDMVLAIARENLRDVVAALVTVVGREDATLGDAVAAALERLASKENADELASLAVQVWSEALCNPRLAADFVPAMQQARHDLAGAIARQQQLGAVSRTVPADDLAGYVLSALPGYLLQRALLGSATVAGMPAAARALLPGCGPHRPT